MALMKRVSRGVEGGVRGSGANTRGIACRWAEELWRLANAETTLQLIQVSQLPCGITDEPPPGAEWQNGSG